MEQLTQDETQVIIDSLELRRELLTVKLKQVTTDQERQAVNHELERIKSAIEKLKG